ncbi:type II toxin-antitoxin system RelE/ParE family toxin [Dyella mobilis]|uniref:Type II toxin-antitoxin system RelE/ParE family toxin n=1 Tax=Dyella mobilis TaxID=1849582 RepID=A0ABS2KEX2_9GAMM|nr:type II toxin-antitoxin system RelE/ParE family toxin [Dyella mobilis]MBM7129727.1 type II toxin-antitoxin system RelE/ParE family toxin [Dyella mobilis]GLQ98008.1 plasmid stabilization protein [Dyella mobilis]
MIYQIRYTEAARLDLIRLYQFLLQKDATAARRALDAIRKAVGVLESFPYTCRKADAGHPFLRELLISFGSSGYVALFKIDEENVVTIIALRHQREDDYY